MCGIVWCWTGASEKANEALAPVHRFWPPAFDGIAELPFPARNGALEAL